MGVAAGKLPRRVGKMSTRLEGGVPILRIFDVDRAREFYVDWLGFQVDWEHRFDDDAPLYM
jgi:glyoxalase superfamily protein